MALNFAQSRTPVMVQVPVAPITSEEVDHVLTEVSQTLLELGFAIDSRGADARSVATFHLYVATELLRKRLRDNEIS